MAPRAVSWTAESASSPSALRPFSDVLPNGLVFVGTPTTPQCGGTVSLTDSQTLSFSGGALDAGLSTCVVDTVVKADKNGNWQTEPINLSSLFNNRNVDYTITATSVNAADQESEPTMMRFRLK